MFVRLLRRVLGCMCTPMCPSFRSLLSTSIKACAVHYVPRCCFNELQSLKLGYIKAGELRTLRSSCADSCLKSMPI